MKRLLSLGFTYIWVDFVGSMYLYVSFSIRRLVATKRIFVILLELKWFTLWSRKVSLYQQFSGQLEGSPQVEKQHHNLLGQREDLSMLREFLNLVAKFEAVAKN